jgi:hypothetical protein
MTALNVAYIVADQTDQFFDFSVQSAIPVADRFVFVIDRPDAHTWDVIEKAMSVKPTILLHRKYEHESKSADGKQRNHYLDWLKNNAVGEWVLVLDTDEVLSDDAYQLKEITLQDETQCFNIRMRHIIWGACLEDATREVHVVPHRFFKVKPALSYPLVEHPILQGHEQVGQVMQPQIWHFNIVKGLLSEIAKYKKQCVKSNMHSPEELKQWHAMHLLGDFPVKKFSAEELPRNIKKHLCVSDSGEPELYEEKSD